MIRFSNEVEAERLKNRFNQKSSWELLRTRSVVEALHKARDLDWAHKKIQVRAEQIGEDSVEYVIEPFERDCTCPNILRYDDYFLRPDKTKSGG